MAKSTLDLHGFPSEDVVPAIDEFILKHSKSGIKVVRIMTGKGKGIVKKIVVDYLKQAGYPWKFEKQSGQTNEGVICVFMEWLLRQPLKTTKVGIRY